MNILEELKDSRNNNAEVKQPSEKLQKLKALMYPVPSEDVILKIKNMFLEIVGKEYDSIKTFMEILADSIVFDDVNYWEYARRIKPNIPMFFNGGKIDFIALNYAQDIMHDGELVSFPELWIVVTDVDTFLIESPKQLTI
jgi:hypothetical protein